MRILDSNIIIYSYDLSFVSLRAIIKDKATHVSEISKLETLGFHKLEKDEKVYLETVFKTAKILKVDSKIISKAVELKQQHKLGIGDALIAATAIVHDLELLTRNTKDFEAIKGLRVSNPIN